MLKNLLWPVFLGGVDRRLVQVAVTVNLKDLEKLTELVDDGLVVKVDSSWKMEDALLAYDRLATRGKCEKMVVRVQD